MSTKSSSINVEVMKKFDSWTSMWDETIEENFQKFKVQRWLILDLLYIYKVFSHLLRNCANVFIST